MMLVYQNLPPATICPGDTLAFDLGASNQMPPAFASIAFSPTTTESYTTVVGDSAASSPGNNVIGDYETQFTINAMYNFLGGGLIIRFQNGGSAGAANGFNTDSSCDQVQVFGSSGDLSG
jgi:hypothetical protein